MVDKVEVLFQAKGCPDCGEIRRAFQQTVDLEKLSGNFSSNLKAEVLEQIILRDPLKPSLFVWRVNIYRDFCLGCGRAYVTEISRVRVSATQAMRPPNLTGR